MNKKTQTLVVALAMTLTLTFGLSTAYGQKTEDNNSPLSVQQNNHDNNIVGTWVSEVTIRNCQTNAAIVKVQAMNTFNQGGTMLEAGASSTRGPGHGTWASEPDQQYLGRRYSSVFQFYRFNADGTYAGFQKVRRQHVLGGLFDLDALTTNVVFENYNASGVLIGTACATERATRLTQ